VPVSRRAIASHRPAVDPGCAGCAQLSTFRALRRAGLAAAGGLPCDPAAPAAPPPQGPFAEVMGLGALEAGGAAALAGASARGARLVVVADRAGAGAPEAARRALEALGAPVVAGDPADVLGMSASVARAVSVPEVGVVVALAPCARDRAAGPCSPAEISASRCNRCGACLVLGCPAISDPGGEAMAVDPAICTGCGLCPPVCRSGALHLR
jgi:TPP-dependent indolepyruvate ferredoxin oxidoreductase alpha subunit